MALQSSSDLHCLIISSILKPLRAFCFCLFVLHSLLGVLDWPQSPVTKCFFFVFCFLLLFFCLFFVVFFFFFFCFFHIPV